jgi:hypothetical protein
VVIDDLVRCCCLGALIALPPVSATPYVVTAIPGQPSEAAYGPLRPCYPIVIP